MNFDDFVGLPYRAGARGPDAYDCYGLVAAVFLAARGVHLPDWYQDVPGPAGASRAISEALTGETSAGRAVKVQDPQELDIAVVGGINGAHHVGVVVNGGVLHSSKTFGSTWHSMTRFKTFYPRTEFYRWQP